MTIFQVHWIIALKLILLLNFMVRVYLTFPQHMEFIILPLVLLKMVVPTLMESCNVSCVHHACVLISSFFINKTWRLSRVPKSTCFVIFGSKFGFIIVSWWRWGEWIGIMSNCLLLSCVCGGLSYIINFVSIATAIVPPCHCAMARFDWSLIIYLSLNNWSSNFMSAYYYKEWLNVEISNTTIFYVYLRLHWNSSSLEKVYS